MLLLDTMLELPRYVKRVITLFLDSVFILIAYWGAWTIRMADVDVLYSAENWYLLSILLPITLITFMKLGLYRAILRYIGMKAVITILIGTVSSAILFVFLGFLTGYFLPRTIPFLYLALLITFVCGGRFLVRALFTQSLKHNKERVVIYGAGSAGRQLAQSLMQSRDYDPFAFIDDDKNLYKTYILGRSVHSFKSFMDIAQELSITQVLLAMPNINKTQRANILANLEPLAIEVKSIPDMTDLINGDAKIDELHDVRVEDLLGRDSVEADITLLGKNIVEKIVMVTGAGGSIGSELCRQIILLKPKTLILFEASEFMLYNIETELSKLADQHALNVEIIPIIGNVQKQKQLSIIFNTFDVQTVYHAAAYKHVPLVEYNIVEGVRNNVFGTYYSAIAALEAGVETFVLISTDKAVRPTNIMGTTKRIAELVLQGLNNKGSKTTFCMVRFGNVLGSSGSVVPLFKEQINKGGPVTITHKDITRYFMTIPEASQLVIQAGAMAEGGEVFVLDMGESVKISDLAIKMIHLMGLEVKDKWNPQGDIELHYSGLRPGEKLYEELLIGEDSYATDHERINKANEIYLPWEDMIVLLDNLDAASESFDVKSIQELLRNAPTGYIPTSKLSDLFLKKSLANDLSPLH